MSALYIYYQEDTYIEICSLKDMWFESIDISFNKRSLFIGFSLIMGLYFVVMTYIKIKYGLLWAHDYTDWGMSEFLVNYRAGFVRRGLLGEILYVISYITTLAPHFFVISLCLTSFVILLLFLFYYFRKYSIYWWLIPVMVAPLQFLRKDFMLIGLIFLVFYTYRFNINGYVKVALQTFITLFIILIHEAEFFSFVPLLWLLWFSDKDMQVYRPVVWIAVLIECLTMVLMLVTTGHAGIGWEIQYSLMERWPEFFDENSDLGYTLGSLDWSVMDALRYNDSILLFGNASIKNPSGLSGILIKIIMLVAAPYLVTRYVFISRRQDSASLPFTYDGFCALVSMQMLCIIPMLLGLTCDYGRVIFQTLVVALGFAFILPRKVDAIFPAFYVRIVGNVGKYVDRLIPKRLLTLCLIILMVGFPYSRFTWSLFFGATPLGFIYDILSQYTSQYIA